MGGVTQTVHAINQSQCIHNGIFKKSVFGAAIKDPEIVFRQFLFSNQIAHKINESLIKASADTCDKLKYPILKLWRKALKEQGFKVAELHSAFLFQKLVCMRFLFGVFSILINLFKGVKEIILPRNKFLGEFVFFCGLTENNLPHPDKKCKSYDIISWYLKWQGKVEKLETIVHTVSKTNPIEIDGIPVISLPEIIPPFSTFEELFRYTYWAISAIILSFVDLFRGRWWHPIMLSEASQSALIRIHKIDNLAKDYLFHNSSWIYRPLWTYDAEKKGSRISFYFYS